jgi:hypothetical protein
MQSREVDDESVSGEDQWVSLRVAHRNKKALCACVNPRDLKRLRGSSKHHRSGGVFMVGDCLCPVRADKKVKKGLIEMDEIRRRLGFFTLGKSVYCKPLVEVDQQRQPSSSVA